MNPTDTFKLTITVEHLDRAIAALSVGSPTKLVTHCVIAMAAKDMFGETFDAMGIDLLFLRASGSPTPFVCREAVKITRKQINPSTRDEIAAILPLELTFVPYKI